MSNLESPALAHPIPNAARMLGIGRTKLYELIDAGELRTFRLGTRRLIPETELQRLIADRLTIANVDKAAA